MFKIFPDIVAIVECVSLCFGSRQLGHIEHGVEIWWGLCHKLEQTLMTRRGQKMEKLLVEGDCGLVVGTSRASSELVSLFAYTNLTSFP